MKSWEKLDAQALVKESLRILKMNEAQLSERLGIKEDTLKKIKWGTNPMSPPVRAHLQTLVAAAAAMHDLAHTPRGAIREAMAKHNLTVQELAQLTGYKAAVLQAVIEEGSGQASEKMIEAICEQLPELDKAELMAGSDEPVFRSEDGVQATYGLKPEIRMPDGKTARYVPLLSWAQAGALDAEHTDEAYGREGVLAVDIEDRRAFGLTIRGDSMIPRINEGDVAIVCPSWTPRTGDVVIARTVDGDVMCKVFQRTGEGVVLSSYNAAHPPIELRADQVEWIYPVGQVTQSMRRK